MGIWYGETMEKTDEQLVSESILDTEGSFDELVKRYTRPVYNFCYRLTGGIQTAEDCTQETFIKVWKSLKKYDPEKSFRSWVFTIARNTTTDFLRKKKAIPFSNLSVDELRFEDTVQDTADLPEAFLAKAEDRAFLEKLLDELSPESKSVILLHHQEGLTFDEIGTIMGKPMNTVKSWYRRAIKKMQDMA